MHRFLVTCLFLWTMNGFAVDLELTQGVNSALPIGIASFGSSEQASQLTEIVANDLRLSGQFKIIHATGSDLQTWRRLGADTLLTGELLPLGPDRMDVRFQLRDAAAQGRVLLSKQYQISTPALRGLAHHISDELYQKLTGERGIFSTRIAYILVQRRGEAARYSLEVADFDGSYPRSLLISTEPIMSPTWSPDGKKIAYVSFEKKRAQIFTVDVENGARRLLTNFTGINGAPAFSPDGRNIAVVLSKGGSPKLYVVDLSSGAMKQLTFGEAIDTEPRYAPDGRSILFTSGRAGTPQIYQLNLASGKIERLTYSGNYNARASFTPNQQAIVMLHREDKNFNIAAQSLGRNDLIQLTDSQQDESPSISPNGRLVLYATHDSDRGILAIVSIDGRIRMRLPAREGDVQEPAWSPYLG